MRSKTLDERLFDLIERVRRHGVLQGLEALDVHRRQEPAHDRQNLTQLDVDAAKLQHPGQHPFGVPLVEAALPSAKPGRYDGLLMPGGGVRAPAPKDFVKGPLHQGVGENDAKNQLSTNEADEETHRVGRPGERSSDWARSQCFRVAGYGYKVPG